VALNYIWFGFFVIAFLVALIKLIFLQDTAVFPALLNSTFESARTGFEVSIYLTGAMALWLGLMRIGEKGGMVAILSKLVGPFFEKLFPEIPKNHPAIGSLIMNFSANMLGLDNAATPLGLKAMKEMQEVNQQKDTASNAQIMFLVLNSSGLSIIPLAILIDRSVKQAINPTDVFIPILIATSISTLVGLIVVSLYQRINLFNKVIMLYLGGFSLFLAFIVWYFTSLDQQALQSQSQLYSSLIILTLIVSFLALGWYRKVPLFETFVEGAKEGFDIAVKIIPYLVGFLVAIGLFRVSGSLGYITEGIAWVVGGLGFDTRFVDALPVAIMKPLSGGSARGMMLDTIDAFGVDSFVGRTASIFRGATETTFYIIAVYFGSVSIRKTRYAITAGLLADISGIIAGIFVAYLFFG
jgi:spore maturation protein SpmA